ncbi:hypothetical protein [Allorhodopirellula heiligendammensis]|uniref:Peptidase C39-like domain-containing protein n=1 Tax=Allorhodopirellula heiligendammensis TaxID=2714739 RepID=A0A5C6C074_9BACT|nr:hypothetical protein [Allorhodopirellula heiligendammensis]TWU17980.1 hypothetical protein Poly21_01330 [Allorhodopirellula heiligendammensis]
MQKLFLILALLGLVCGCNQSAAPILIPNQPPPAEVPAANLPESLRPYNWTAADGSGSCVNASTVYALQWRGKEAMADWWRRNHSGGETDTSIRQSHDAAGLRYVFTRSADESFLDWCSRTRRGAIIWFYTRHCVTFVGFANVDGREYAFLNDNNRPTRYIKVERAEFLRRWADYGGFALSLLDPPVPPPLYPAYRSVPHA